MAHEKISFFSNGLLLTKISECLYNPMRRTNQDPSRVFFSVIEKGFKILISYLETAL
jgi:hypothetical protein